MGEVGRKIKHNHCLKIRICLLTQAAPCVGWEVGEIEVVLAVCVNDFEM